MSNPVSELHSLVFSAAQNVAVVTASATVSAALPAGTVAVRLVSACTGYFRTDGSASPTTGAYLPANTIVFAECGGSGVVSFICLATASPQTLHIVPCVS